MIIDEAVSGDLSPGFTDVTEGALLGINPADDLYGVYLAHAPAVGTFVYVTVSAAMNPAGGARPRRRALLSAGDIIDTIGLGDSILLATGGVGPGVLPAAAYDARHYAQRHAIHIPARAVVLVFDARHWDKAGSARMRASRPSTSRPSMTLLAEGDRTVTISHSVLSTDSTFDHAIVRNVEVTVHDNDQPAVVVTQLDATTPFNLGPIRSTAAPSTTSPRCSKGTDAPLTSVDDYFAIELATQPSGTVRVAVNPQDNRVVAEFERPALPPCQRPAARRCGGRRTYVDFDSTNWNKPIIVTTHAVQRGPVEDPHDTSIITVVDGSARCSSMPSRICRYR